MDLKDLADEATETLRRWRSGKETPQTPKINRAVGSRGEKWLVIQAHLLDGEHILLILDRQHLKEARHTYPDQSIYFLPEIAELQRHRDSPRYREIVQKVHMVKKTFDGWIVPADSPLFQQEDPHGSGEPL